jgi:hypothetical protein
MNFARLVVPQAVVLSAIPEILRPLVIHLKYWHLTNDAKAYSHHSSTFLIR